MQRRSLVKESELGKAGRDDVGLIEAEIHARDTHDRRFGRQGRRDGRLQH
jgi:hypothetical protein